MVKIEKTPDSGAIEAAVRENEGYCPCAVSKNPDTKCMCKEFRNMPEGLCHCGLFKKTIIDN